MPRLIRDFKNTPLAHIDYLLRSQCIGTTLRQKFDFKSIWNYIITFLGWLILVHKVSAIGRKSFG